MSTPIRSSTFMVAHTPPGGGVLSVTNAGPNFWLVRRHIMVARNVACYASVSPQLAGTVYYTDFQLLPAFTAGPGYSAETRYVLEPGDILFVEAGDEVDFVISGFELTP